jgi:hypothetical protein
MEMPDDIRRKLDEMFPEPDKRDLDWFRRRIDEVHEPVTVEKP